MCIMQFVLLKPVLVMLPYLLRLCQLNLDKRPPYHDGHVDFGSTVGTGVGGMGRWTGFAGFVV